LCRRRALRICDIGRPSYGHGSNRGFPYPEQRSEARVRWLEFDVDVGFALLLGCDVLVGFGVMLEKSPVASTQPPNPPSPMIATLSLEPILGYGTLDGQESVVVVVVVVPLVEQAVIVRLHSGSLHVVVVVPGYFITEQSTSHSEIVVRVRQLDDGSSGLPPPPPPPASVQPTPRQLVGGQVLQPGGLGQNGPIQPQIPKQWL
jgi:hypothetical protein